MCSNSSSSGGGGGDNDHSSVGLKKPKRQRVPKRGPGVAELEKILREQEKKDDPDRVKTEGFSSCLISPFSTSYHPRSSFLSSSNSLPGNRTVVPDRNGFSPPPPPMTTLYGNGSGVQIRGSAMILPGKALLPTMWSGPFSEPSKNGEGPKMTSGFPFSVHISSGSTPNETIPSPPALPRKRGQSQAHMVNLFPHPTLPSLSSPSSCAGLYHLVEPPSNQRSYSDYSSVCPEEEMIVGAKRPRPMAMGINTPPAPPLVQYQAPPFPLHMQRLDSSSSSVISRDSMAGSSLDLNTSGCFAEHEKPSGRYFTLGSPTTSAPGPACHQEICKFSLFSYQHEGKEGIEDTQQRSGTSAPAPKKPFYSFLSTEEQTIGAETSLSVYHGRSEARAETIDLDLKL